MHRLPFPYAHATHPDALGAVRLVLAQLHGQLAQRRGTATPTLGLLYLSDFHADAAQAVLDALAAALPEVTDWAGASGVGVLATGVEYLDQPALAVMLCDLPADVYRVFSGVAPLPPGLAVQSALVHADPGTPDVAELIAEMAARTRSGLAGGLAASRHGPAVQLAVSGHGNLRGQGAAGGVFSGGLSGVAFMPAARVVSRVSQGARPAGPVHTITAADGAVALTLDGRPALEVLLQERQLAFDPPQRPDAGALARLRATFVALADAGASPVRPSGDLAEAVRVRHLIGLDPARGGVALGDWVQSGQQLVFCVRDAAAARADLVRVCSDIRAAFEPEEADAHPDGAQAMRGAVYVSCASRGGGFFGGPDAELQTIRRALGDVPLVGFFAAGEIAGAALHGYSGVLSVFG